MSQSSSNFDVELGKFTDDIGDEFIAGSVGPDVEKFSETMKGFSPHIFSIIDGDDRITDLFTKNMPERLICALRIYSSRGELFHGTGWLAGPSVVMTCGHNVHHNRFGGWAKSIEVIPGLSEDRRPFGETTATRFSAHKKWVADHDEAKDIACIHLDAPLGDALGWFAIRSIDAAGGLKDKMAVCAGYPEYQASFVRQRHGNGQIVEVRGSRIYHQADTNDGQSGGPIWLEQEGDAPPTAIAVHTYEKVMLPGLPPREANSGTLIDSNIFKLIVSWRAGAMPH